MATWNLDFLDLLTALNRADAKYLLIGGHAVGFYAKPRATKDFDLFVEASANNSTRVFQALSDFGAPLSGISTATFAHKGEGFRMGSPPFRIELLTEVSGLEFADAWKNRSAIELDGVRCFLIAKSDLIANKRASARPQDLADVAALEKSKTGA